MFKLITLSNLPWRASDLPGLSWTNFELNIESNHLEILQLTFTKVALNLHIISARYSTRENLEKSGNCHMSVMFH